MGLGLYLWFAADVSHGDPLDAILVVGLGLVGAFALLVRNVRRTSLTVGVLGSVVQAVLVPVVLVLLVVIRVITSIRAPVPVYLVR